MALPKLNTNLIYETKVPSTGQTIRFRPFLVGEEKLFLIADQTDSVRVLYETIERVVDQCVQNEDFDVKQLKSYDLHFLFLQLRAKSVGETEILSVRCGECDGVHKYSVDFENEVIVTERTVENTVDLGNNILITLREPDVELLIALQENTDNETDMAFASIEHIIDKVYTNDEVFDFQSESDAQKQEFVHSMLPGQLAQVFEYVQDMPKVKMDMSFVCTHCGATNVRVLDGISDFFG